VEDQVDAVVCAYVALFAERWPERTATYGDFETGYIVTPSLAPDQSPTPRRRVVPPPTDELHERLTHLAALLQDAQAELIAIRERLYRL
jgi:hypothetical protein